MKILLYISVLILIYLIILYTLLKHQIQKPKSTSLGIQGIQGIQGIPNIPNIPSIPNIQGIPSIRDIQDIQTDHFTPPTSVPSIPSIQSVRTIPRHIFTYWNSSSLPPIISTCISSWKIYNPTYTITVITPQNLATYIAPFKLSDFKLDPTFVARQSDFIRIIVILKHGGIWMDSSIYCNQPLTWLPLGNQPVYDMIAYTNPQTSSNPSVLPIIENWFFAAPKNSSILQAWLDESIYMKTFATEDEYVNKVQAIKKTQGLNGSLPYLVMHLTLARVYHKNLESSSTSPKYNVKLFDSIAPDGPFHYLAKVDWDSEKAIKNFKKDLTSNQKLVKLRGVEREAYDKI